MRDARRTARRSVRDKPGRKRAAYAPHTSKYAVGKVTIVIVSQRFCRTGRSKARKWLSKESAHSVRFKQAPSDERDRKRLDTRMSPITIRIVTSKTHYPNEAILFAKPLRSRMSLGDSRLQTINGHMRVDLRRGKTRVPEHLLDRTQIRSSIEHVGSEGMANVMGRIDSR